MKKIFYSGLVLMTLMSCQKEELGQTRNYIYTWPQGASNCYIQFTGESDDDFVARIKREVPGKSDKTIYLNPTTYEGGDVANPDPKYMLFPIVIESMNSEWGWDRANEYDRIGEQAFCDKYFNGERTAGMLLNK